MHALLPAPPVAPHHEESGQGQRRHHHTCNNDAGYERHGHASLLRGGRGIAGGRGAGASVLDWVDVSAPGPSVVDLVAAVAPQVGVVEVGAPLGSLAARPGAQLVLPAQLAQVEQVGPPQAEKEAGVAWGGGVALGASGEVALGRAVGEAALGVVALGGVATVVVAAVAVGTWQAVAAAAVGT